MAQIIDLIGSDKLREIYVKINTNFNNINTDINNINEDISETNNRISSHESSKTAHDTDSIVNKSPFNGEKLTDVLEVIENRFNNIVSQSGEDITEIVDSHFSEFKNYIFGSLSARINSIEKSLNFYDPRDFGANANGNSKKLSSKYATLAEAQVQFPLAQDLSDEYDTVVLEKLYNSLPEGSTIKIEGTYLINRKINISKKMNTIGSGEFKFSSDYVQESNTLKMFHITATNVNFKGITFNTNVLQGSGGTTNNVYLWYSTGSGLALVQNCTFLDLPSNGSNFNGAIAFLSGGSGRNICVCNVFERCPGSVFTQQPNDITICNTSLNPKDVCYVANGTNAKKYIVGFNNVLTTTTQPAAARITAEQGAPEMIVIGNTIDGICEGYGIGFDTIGTDTTAANGGIIAYNIIDGLNMASTGYVSGLVIRQYYTGVKVFGNVIKNIVSGSNNCAVLLETGGNVEFYDNTVEGTTGSASRNMVIIPKTNSGTIKIKRNKFIQVPTTGVGIVFAAGTATNAKVWVEENDFFNGGEGIQTVNLGGSDMSAIGDFVAKDNTFTNVLAPTHWSNFFGAWAQSQMYQIHKYPHHFSKNYKKIYGSSMPTNGYWTAKDEVIMTSPTVITGHLRSYMIYGWKRITTGSGNTLNVDWVEMRMETRTYADVWWRFRLKRVTGGFTCRLLIDDNICAPHGVSDEDSGVFTTSATPPDIDWQEVGSGSSLIKYGLAGQDYICISPPFNINYMLGAYISWQNTNIPLTVHTRNQVAEDYFVVSFKKLDGSDINLLSLPVDSETPQFIDFIVGFNTQGF